MNTDDNLIQHARARFDHVTARKLLKEKYEARLLFAHNGGMFRASPELLAFVQSWPIQELYIADLYDNPIEVDKQVFLVKLQQHYHEQMNAWHVEHQEMNNKR
jgi:bifunctional DNase/RNase